MIYRETELKDIIDYWGEEKQKTKAIEELSELQKELCKNLIGQSNEKALKEEIADVQLMINQLMIIYGFTKNGIEYCMNQKIKRTRDIIDSIR